ncbi:hypothetical protein C1883_23340 [Pseudomonas protegens]|nr:hypothetical protein C1883_23340 [Pseudomonas protegens]
MAPLKNYYFLLWALHPGLGKSFAQVIAQSTRQGVCVPDTLPELADTMSASPVWGAAASILML